jgi:serine/threonine protein kinase
MYGKRISSTDISNCADRFISIKTLGEGAFGKVKLVLDTRTSKKTAIKYLPKDQMKHYKLLQREVAVLRLLHHPHIVQLYDVFVR